MENNDKKWTIPGYIMDIIWQDSTIFEDIAKIKKSNFRVYPKYDQWYDGDGLHMEFAIAGFSPDDISIKTQENELVIESIGIKPSVDLAASLTEKNQDIKGVARRKFRNRFLVSSTFDLEQMSASMQHGLLRIDIPVAISPIEAKNVIIKKML